MIKDEFWRKSIKGWYFLFLLIHRTIISVIGFGALYGIKSRLNSRRKELKG
jgi:hypothetical protein